jgi:hypothetical protein
VGLSAPGESHIDRGVIAQLEDINSGKALYHRLGETISPRWAFSATALTGIEEMDPVLGELELLNDHSSISFLPSREDAFWKSNFKIIWQTLNAINDHRPYWLALVAVRRKAWSLANPSQPKRHVPKRDILQSRIGSSVSGRKRLRGKLVLLEPVQMLQACMRWKILRTNQS